MRQLIELFEKSTRPDAIFEMLRPDSVFPQFPRGFYILKPEEREDIKAGRCKYMEHDGVPILDYRTDARPR